MTKDDLYVIAIDPNESLDMRYAAARELQKLRTEITEDVRWILQRTLIRRNKRKPPAERKAYGRW